jgi:hypothetical protein
MKTWWMQKIAWFMLAAAVILLGLGGAVMLLWNAVLPDVLGTAEITYWQAVGLLALTHILFRGVGHLSHRSGWKSKHWKEKFEKKLAAMTPEERDQFREEWKRRCGWDPGERHGGMG